MRTGRCRGSWPRTMWRAVRRRSFALRARAGHVVGSRTRAGSAAAGQGLDGPVARHDRDPAARQASLRRAGPAATAKCASASRSCSTTNGGKDEVVGEPVDLKFGLHPISIQFQPVGTRRRADALLGRRELCPRAAAGLRAGTCEVRADRGGCVRRPDGWPWKSIVARPAIGLARKQPIVGVAAHAAGSAPHGGGHTA